MPIDSFKDVEEECPALLQRDTLLCVRHRVQTSSLGIIPSWRYSVIDRCQSISGMCSPTAATISSVCPGSGVLGLAKAQGQAPSVTVGSRLPCGVLITETSVPSLGEVPGRIVGASSSSRMEGLKRSCTNMLGGGDSQLDPSRARASADSLSR
jgi:hypothetical protein